MSVDDQANEPADVEPTIAGLQAEIERLRAHVTSATDLLSNLVELVEAYVEGVGMIDLPKVLSRVRNAMRAQAAVLDRDMSHIDEQSERLDEIQRQKKQIEILSDPELLDLSLAPGGELRLNLEPYIGAKVLAASFADMIGDAKNWRAVEVGPFPSDQGMLIVTVQRKDGKSPVEMLQVAKREIERLQSTQIVTTMIDDR